MNTFKTILEAQSFPDLSLGKDVRGYDNLLSYKPEIEAALQQGEIANPRFIEFKSRASRFVEELYTKTINEPFTYGKGSDHGMPEDLHEITYNYMGYMHHINSVVKKLAKVQPTDHPAFNALQEFADTIVNLNNLVVYLKSIMVKASAKRAKEVEKKEVYQKALTSHKDVIKTFNELKAAVNDISEDIYQNIYDRYEGYVDDFRGREKTSSVYFRELEGEAKLTLQKVLDFHHDEEHTIKTEWEQPLEKLAGQVAADMIDLFVNKGVDKVAHILNQKNNLATVKIGNLDYGSGRIEGSLHFNFKDNSKFILRNSIVVSHSKYGKGFYRFPATFHNVELSNGKKITQPSLEKMEKEFI